MRMSLKKRLSFILAALLAAPAFAEVRVTDDLGRTVVLAQPTRRIVSLAPHATETLFTAGAGDRVVGAVSYSDYPEDAKKIPRVGGYHNLDLERIVALRPDLVVAWASGNLPAQVERLRALGMTVYVSEPHAIEDVARNIERLGALAGTEIAAQRAAAAFRARHERLRARYADRPAVSMFYQIWNRPLMTINGEHLISKVIALCGGVNVFAGLPVLAPKVDVEQVLAADPEAIVASGMGEARPDWLADWRRWPQLRAVRRDNLFFIPPDLIQRHTPRILDGAERLCAALELARTRR
jgi:iron complex transport system substrate-binding protein